MDEGEAEADGDGGEAFGSALVGRADDDQQEERGKDDFYQEAGEQRVVVGRVRHNHWRRSHRPAKIRLCRWR